MYPKIALAQSIIEICSAKKITEIVISPGSRNAPLTIGFVNNNQFNCYSIVDERCAAFFALGIAQQTNKPVVLLCTSGSALLNYYPAVAEAFYSQIPLVIISADRPSNKIDIGDGQTIRQENVFSNHSLYNANLVEDASFDNDVRINEAINLSMQLKGPVHINAPFEEPLYETTNQLLVQPQVLDSAFSETIIPEFENFVSIFNKSNKKLVLIGTNAPNEIECKYINILASNPSVVIMTEATSNVHHENIISNIDTIITPFSKSEFEKFKPDLLITLGGMIVSKRIKSFLRKYTPEHHWHIDSLRAYDTFGCLSHHFKLSPNVFFESFLPKTVHTSSDYFKDIAAIRQSRKLKHQDFLFKAPFSDMKAFNQIIPSIPLNTSLQISNSSAIRYMQLFDIDTTIDVFCNRGTSGIDGSTSTAIGAAVGSLKPTILITGDISFFYDSNALWNSYIPDNFKIIILNNKGGGIFRILPGHQENKVFNTFFETTHNLNAQNIAKMYGFEYFTAESEGQLVTALPDFFKNTSPSILEIFTPTNINDKVLLDYFRSLS